MSVVDSGEVLVILAESFPDKIGFGLTHSPQAIDQNSSGSILARYRPETYLITLS